MLREDIDGRSRSVCSPCSFWLCFTVHSNFQYKSHHLSALNINENTANQAVKEPIHHYCVKQAHYFTQELQMFSTNMCKTFRFSEKSIIQT